MPDTKYNRNFIVKVIAALNFAESNAINSETLRNFREKLGAQFGGLNEVERSEVLVQNDESGVQSKVISSTYWTIESIDKIFTLEIQNSAISIVLNQYINYSDLKPTLDKVFKDFLEEFKEVTEISRAGLRYINAIKLDGSNTDWTEYIESELAKHTQITERSKLRRAMSNIVIQQSEDIYISINAGIYNQYFPGPIVDNGFTLDIDAFTSTTSAPLSVSDKFVQLNDIATAIFEQSIKENLRNILRS